MRISGTSAASLPAVGPEMLLPSSNPTPQALRCHCWGPPGSSARGLPGPRGLATKPTDLVLPCLLPSSAPACSVRPFAGSQIPQRPSEGVGLAQGGGLAARMLQKTSNLLAEKVDQNSDPQLQALAPAPGRSHQDRPVSSVAAGRGELTSCCKATWQRSMLLLGRLSSPPERPSTPWVPLSRRQKQRQLVLPLHTQGLFGL